LEKVTDSPRIEASMGVKTTVGAGVVPGVVGAGVVPGAVPGVVGAGVIGWYAGFLVGVVGFVVGFFLVGDGVDGVVTAAAVGEVVVAATGDGVGEDVGAGFELTGVAVGLFEGEGVEARVGLPVVVATGVTVGAVVVAAVATVGAVVVEFCAETRDNAKTNIKR
jgi:hypothetical protein